METSDPLPPTILIRFPITIAVDGAYTIGLSSLNKIVVRITALLL